MDRFENVEDFLRHHQKNRPQTFKEIVLCVNKSEPAVYFEIRKLVKRREVTVLEVKFRERVVPFYTLREAMSVEMKEYPGAEFRKVTVKHT